jgi:hypothetical protein
MNITKKDIIYWITIILLSLILFSSIRACYNNKNDYNTNVTALTDSIAHLKTKSGQQMVKTSTYTGYNAKMLKQVDSLLYARMKDMKIKQSHITNVTTFDGKSDFGTHDTVYIASKTEKDSNSIIRDFNFNNAWRTLEGQIRYVKDTLGIKIMQDKVKFDYTIAQDKNNKVYITSSNPYVEYNKISSFQIKQKKQKHWNIGPQFGIGYDFTNKSIVPQFGFGITYGLINF